MFEVQIKQNLKVDVQSSVNVLPPVNAEVVEKPKFYSETLNHAYKACFCSRLHILACWVSFASGLLPYV